jgi:OFA family oxalate/formate antiporter-like MFS transporter
MSFGFSAMIAGPFMQYLISNIGVVETLRSMGSIYFVIMILSANLLKVPKREEDVNVINQNVKKMMKHSSFTTSEAMRTIDFWLLWIVFFINISCGIAVLSIASPMAEEVGMSAIEAAGMVGMIGLLNGGGRIFFASVSDYIGRGITYIAFFLIEVFSFYLLATTSNPFLFQSLVFVIVSCYGGGFSCMPAYLADIFGTKWLSAIHGRILTAWGLAGIFGPLMITICYEKFGNHTMTLKIFSILFVFSLILAIILFKRNRK